MRFDNIDGRAIHELATKYRDNHTTLAVQRTHRGDHTLGKTLFGDVSFQMRICAHENFSVACRKFDDTVYAEKDCDYNSAVSVALRG